MMTTRITLNVTTNPGENPSEVADSYGQPWRNAVKGCDADGCGRVFIDCDERDTADYLIEQLGNDERVQSVRERI